MIYQALLRLTSRVEYLAYLQTSRQMSFAAFRQSVHRACAQAAREQQETDHGDSRVLAPRAGDERRGGQ